LAEIGGARARTREKRMHRGILVEKFEGKKPPRTPGLGWEDIFKTGLM